VAGWDVDFASRMRKQPKLDTANIAGPYGLGYNLEFLFAGKGEP
jgi:hypothetical protein